MLDCSDMSGGLATAYPPHAIADNQVAAIKNALIEKRGHSRSPAYLGYQDTPLFPHNSSIADSQAIRGLFLWLEPSGLEIYIVVSNNGNIYRVTFNGDSLTLSDSLYNMSSDADCVATNAFGKLWICCGTKKVKCEWITDHIAVYPVGIAKPSRDWTISAVDVVGYMPTLDSVGHEFILDSPTKGVIPETSSLAPGDYKLMVSYARNINGVIVLNSEPTDYGTITVGAGQSIRIIPIPSNDAQVTDVVTWICEPNGSIYYYYGSAPHTDSEILIAGDGAKNIFQLMYEQAAGNQLPPTLDGWLSFDGRLWGWRNGENNIYYSMKAQNVYDIERWTTTFHIPTVPFAIISLHACGNDLYVNTSVGLFKIPNGDVNAKPVAVVTTSSASSRQIYFQFWRTVVEYNNLLMGLTNDGWRAFDGTQFSDDMAKDIKPIIVKLARDFTGNGDVAHYPPVAIIHRRDKRTEYQLSYMDAEIGTSVHNMRLVANLSNLSSGSVAWEQNEGGFSSAIVLSGNTFLIAQNSDVQGESASTIARESGVSDKWCYASAGGFLTEGLVKECLVATRAFTGSLWGLNIYERVYLLATSNSSFDVVMSMLDRGGAEARGVGTVGRRDIPILDSEDAPLILDKFALPDITPRSFKVPLPMNAKANQMQLTFKQSADDQLYQVYSVEVYGQQETNVFV